MLLYVQKVQQSFNHVHFYHKCRSNFFLSMNFLFFSSFFSSLFSGKRQETLVIGWKQWNNFNWVYLKMFLFYYQYYYFNGSQTLIGLMFPIVQEIFRYWYYCERLYYLALILFWFFLLLFLLTLFRSRKVKLYLFLILITHIVLIRFSEPKTQDWQ